MTNQVWYIVGFLCGFGATMAGYWLGRRHSKAELAALQGSMQALLMQEVHLMREIYK